MLHPLCNNGCATRRAFECDAVWNMFKRITASCSADEKRMIFSGTAQRADRLNYEPAPSHQEPSRLPGWHGNTFMQRPW